MRYLFLFWFLFIAFVVAFVYLSITLSFSVPIEELDPFRWLFKHNFLGILSWFIVMIIIVIINFLMYFQPNIIRFETPLNPSSALRTATTILLFSNFFIIKGKNKPRNYDAVPILFYSAVFMVSLSILDGGVNTIKSARKGKYYDITSPDYFLPKIS